MGRVFVNGEEQAEARQSEGPPSSFDRSSASMHGIQAERTAVSAFLRRVAHDKEIYARNMLADTMQSKPEADRLRAEANVLIEAAQMIQDGRHWR